jgi:hypothetical protein
MPSLSLSHRENSARSSLVKYPCPLHSYQYSTTIEHRVYSSYSYSLPGVSSKIRCAPEVASHFIQNAFKASHPLALFEDYLQHREALV